MAKPFTILAVTFLFLPAWACGIEGDLEEGLLDPDVQERQSCVVEINASIQAELDTIRFCGIPMGCVSPLFDVEWTTELMLDPVRSVTVARANSSGLFWGHLERAADAPGYYDLFLVDAYVDPESFSERSEGHEALEPPPSRRRYTISYATDASHVRFAASEIAIQLARAWAVLGTRLTQREGPTAWHAGNDWESVEIITDAERRGLRHGTPKRTGQNSVNSVDLARWILLHDFINLLQTATKPEDGLPVDDPRIADRVLRWMSDELDLIRREPQVGRPARVLASRFGLELPDDHGPLITSVIILPGLARYPLEPLCEGLPPW